MTEYVPRAQMTHMPAPASELGLVTTRRPVPALTPRQADILRLAATGLTYRGIGAELGIAMSTVKNTVHEICERWDVQSLIEAFALAGWLVVGPLEVRDRRYAA